MLMTGRLCEESAMKRILTVLLWGGMLLLALTGCDGGGSAGERQNADNNAVVSFSRGDGPVFYVPENMAVEADGQIVVVDGGISQGESLAAVWRVDPVTGNRTIIWVWDLEPMVK